ncbi:hypothetical protein [Amycolatopsis regifaucium]|uniref:Uncharacterized protein n=1 Tax=Amycolatopsis regifaucium TaxID=546365 RepID=A0A154MWT2_9PSEU|nr:hypothetical protein [Amycolatopsis regifaucium]KZB88761.1 hypothetical protein AVL48_01175 [Amycolatopsis regifaucium]OKA07114.1 hypothetical protein ATP06_0214610 [Amycolatopsis regifaucium]SFI58006.1 hypothetical protein SAMN04489731_111235 [Amycolatopsis regifaucium]
MPESPSEPDDTTVDAVGKLVFALETVEQARGHLYAFHHLTGTADFALSEAVEALRKAGHPDWAERIQTELIGLNVLPERWTFQLIEEYDDGYYAAFRDMTRDVTDDLSGGRRHLYEERIKRQRRTAGRPGHEMGKPST